MVRFRTEFRKSLQFLLFFGLKYALGSEKHYSIGRIVKKKKMFLVQFAILSKRSGLCGQARKTLNGFFSKLHISNWTTKVLGGYQTFLFKILTVA